MCSGDMYWHLLAPQAGATPRFPSDLEALQLSERLQARAKQSSACSMAQHFQLAIAKGANHTAQYMRVSRSGYPGAATAGAGIEAQWGAGIACPYFKRHQPGSKRNEMKISHI